MPQVSRRKLDPDKLEKIFNLFFDLVIEIKDKQQAEMVLKEILTPTEQTMVAKRIAAFYLFLKKIKPVEIEEALNLSRSTVFYLKFLFDNSKTIRKFLSKRVNSEKIKNFLKDAFIELFYGMPKKGSDWSADKKIYFAHKRKLKEPI